MSGALFCLYRLLWTYFTALNIVSIVDFEHVIVCIITAVWCQINFQYSQHIYWIVCLSYPWKNNLISFFVFLSVISGSSKHKHDYLSLAKLLQGVCLRHLNQIENAKKLLLEVAARYKQIWFQHFLDFSLDVETFLTHFIPIFHFCTSWKRQKTFGFLTFSGGYKNRALGWNRFKAISAIFIKRLIIK